MDELGRLFEASLLEALEGVGDYTRDLELRKDRHIWKDVEFPCSLHSTFSSLRKSDLNAIRQMYGFKNLSSLNKADLAVELSKLIPSQIRHIFLILDNDVYSLVKKVINNSGIYSAQEYTNSEVEVLANHSILFPGIIDNERVLFMPDELIRAFLEADSGELEQIVHRNTEWLQLAQGMLYYYGLAEPWILMEKIRSLTGQDVDFMEFQEVMSFAEIFHSRIYFTHCGYINKRVEDVDEIFKAQSSKNELPYYTFTKAQLLNACELDYIDKTPEISMLADILQESYQMSEIETDEMLAQILYLINNEAKPMPAIQFLLTQLELPSLEFMKGLADLMMVLYENTRQWALKGHTPNELPLAAINKSRKPVQTDTSVPHFTGSNVIDLKTRAKILRNDPCPCGSGKKYKSCCGKD